MKPSFISAPFLSSCFITAGLLLAACSDEDPITIKEGRSSGGNSSSTPTTGGSSSTSSGGDGATPSSDDDWETSLGGAAGGTGDWKSPVEEHGHLRVSGTQLVDEGGASVQLKGISSQWLNWESDGYALSLDALIWMRDHWGLNLIRAAMGAESDAPGSYLDENNLSAGKADMLRQVKIVVDNAVEAGVYVIVDFHSHSAHLHEAEAAEFFEEMVKLYGDKPNVLFEPFNEPTDISPTEKLEWPELKSYHEAIVDTIRSNDTDDNENVVILGTPRWSQDVDDAAASPLEGSNLMYTIHFYSCTHGASLLNKAKKALTDGLPLFATEWGATEADGGTGATPVCATEADEWHDWMDQNSVSWAAWKLDDCDGQSNADTSCILNHNAALDGGWTAADLNGHGLYVVDKILN